MLNNKGIAAVAVLALVVGFFGRRLLEQKVPEQSVEIGHVLQTPCEMHGSHAVTVISTQIVRTYNLNRDDGAEAVFTQEELLEFIKELENEKSGQ